MADDKKNIGPEAEKPGDASRRRSRQNEKHPFLHKNTSPGKDSLGRLLYTFRISRWYS